MPDAEIDRVNEQLRELAEVDGLIQRRAKRLLRYAKGPRRITPPIQENDERQQ